MGAKDGHNGVAGAAADLAVHTVLMALSLGLAVESLGYYLRMGANAPLHGLDHVIYRTAFFSMFIFAVLYAISAPLGKGAPGWIFYLCFSLAFSAISTTVFFIDVYAVVIVNAASLYFFIMAVMRGLAGRISMKCLTFFWREIEGHLPFTVSIPNAGGRSSAAFFAASILFMSLTGLFRAAGAVYAGKAAGAAYLAFLSGLVCELYSILKDGHGRK